MKKEIKEAESSDDRLNKAVSKGFIGVMTVFIFIICIIATTISYKEGSLSIRGAVYITVITTLLFYIVFYLRSCISVLENRLYKVEEESKEIKTSVSKYFSIVDERLNKLPQQVKRDAMKLIEAELGGVGVDIHQRSASWAVICIQGKKHDFVKFIDLPDKDIRDIQQFLRHFDRRRMNVDMPNGMPKDIFFKID